MKLTDISQTLIETPELNTLRKEIVRKVKDEESETVLHKVDSVLSVNSVRDDLKDAFLVSIGKISSASEIAEDMLSEFETTPGSPAERRQFMEELKQGKLINVSALMSQRTTFGEVFSSDFAMRFFEKVFSYRAGVNRKGPGEYALMIMSPSIHFPEGPGDIVVEANGKEYVVEVKAAKGTNGGRFGIGDYAAPRSAVYGSVFEEIEKALKGTKDLDVHKVQQMQELAKSWANKSIAIGAFVKQLHIFFEPKVVGKIVGEAVKHTFGPEIAKSVGQAAADDPSGIKADTVYGIENFEWYKEKDGFDYLMTFSLSTKIIYTFGDKKSLLQLRQAGVFNKFGGSLLTSQQSDAFSQLKFAK